jgi:hypothetical protein
MPHPPHSPWFDLPNNICWWVQMWISPLCNFLRSSVTSFLLGPNWILSQSFKIWLRLNITFMKRKYRNQNQFCNVTTHALPKSKLDRVCQQTFTVSSRYIRDSKSSLQLNSFHNFNSLGQMANSGVTYSWRNN